MRIKIDPADKKFSAYIRVRDDWTCQRCHKQYVRGEAGIQNSHFWGRGKETTRFDPDNCDALCFGCHQHFHSNPKEYHDWKLKQLGEEKFKLLEIKARTHGKKDRKLALIIATKLLQEELDK